MATVQEFWNKWADTQHFTYPVSKITECMARQFAEAFHSQVHDPATEGNPSCHVCGAIMVFMPVIRHYKCQSCGATTEPSAAEQPAEMFCSMHIRPFRECKVDSVRGTKNCRFRMAPAPSAGDVVENVTHWQPLPSAPPTVLESSSAQAEQGDKGWISEPYWPTEPRNASYRAGLRDAQKAFTEWKGKVISYESVRPSAPQVAGPSQIADAVIAYLEQHGHESHTRDGIRGVIETLSGSSAPSCPKCGSGMQGGFFRVSKNSTSAIKWRCKGNDESFHEFIINCSAKLIPFFRGAPAVLEPKQKLDITPLVQKWFPEIDPFQARAVSLAIDVSAACSAEPHKEQK